MELLVVVAIIGILAVLVIPNVRGVLDEGERAKVLKNAKEISSMSKSLSALGVAHVVPDSMGGVKATARLLSVGVIVPQGPLQGERFQVSGLSAEEIDKTLDYLDISYNGTELSLNFVGDIP